MMHARTTMTRNARRRAAPPRRGSALLIVIGVLALVAVLGAIYISIGQADTRSAEAVRRADRTGRFAVIAAEQFATTIAMDRFDTFLVPGSLGGGAVNQQLAMRETWDYPYTDWSVRSVREPSGLPEGRLFHRSGRHTEQAADAGFGSVAADPRVPYDPWLSSTEPEYLGPYGPQGGPALPGVRPFSLNVPEHFWLDHRDWRHISNLAVDGRLVNLFNLRPQANPYFPNVVGGYDARAGVGTYPAGTQTRAAMTYGLTLYDIYAGQTGKDAQIQAVDAASDGAVWLPGAGLPGMRRVPLGITGTDLLNTPAAWTMNQRFALLPANQPFFVRDRRGDPAGWASPDYPAYQWADADGDGFYDSRWSELVDASDPTRIRLLQDDPDYRVFFAARVVDLTALVNLNTAGDQVSPPTLNFPTGSGLAEVDLRRLLMMTDQAERWTASQAGSGQLLMPPNSSAAPDGSGLSLGNIDHWPNPAGRLLAEGRGSDPTQTYMPQFSGSIFDAANPVSYQGVITARPDPDGSVLTGARDMQSNELLGAFSYHALRWTIHGERDLDDRYVGVPLTLDPDDVPPEVRLLTHSFFALDLNAPDPTTPLDDPDRQAKRRFEYGALVGSRDLTRSIDRRSIPVTNDGSEIRWGASLFDLTDLTELLTYRGVNDPAVTTRLERALMGRMDNLGAAPGALTRDSARRLSVLLSNRPLDLDRFGHGDGRRKRNPNNANRPFPDVRGQVDAESMALLALSPRSRLTTYNGVAAIKPEVQTRASVPLAASLEAGDVVSSLRGGLSTASGAFGIYAPALAPMAHLRANTAAALPSNPDAFAWVDDLRELDPSGGEYRANVYRTLSYGHNGAEQALRIAGHLAVNMKDANDSDSQPTAATLLLDNSARDMLAEQASLTGTQADRKYYWWAEGQQHQLDPDPTGWGVAGTNSTPFLTDPRRRAVNLFGVEAQPFLVEAASLVVFTDAPRGAPAGGDSDFTAAPCDNPAVRPPDETVANITIDTSLEWGNDDFMLQLLAFKLHNPFDRAVTMPVVWNEDRDRWEPDYYIEYAGRFYALGDYVELEDENNDGTAEAVPEDERYRSATINAGSSRVFYVLANNQIGPGDVVSNTLNGHDFGRLDDRWDRNLTWVDTDNNPATGPAWEWINRQLRVTGGGAPARIKEFDPETGELRDSSDTESNGRKWRDITTQVPASGAVPAVEMNETRRNDTTSVRLWRRMTMAGENDNDGGNNISQFNLIENDLLLDRLSRPAAAGNVLAAHAPLSGTNEEVTNTMGFRHGDDCDRNDNTGWTMALWGTIRRPTGGADAVEEGHLPSWLIEVRDGSLTGNTGVSSRNIALRWDHATSGIEGLADGLDAADFAPGAAKDYNPVTFRSDREVQESMAALFRLGRDSVVYSLSMELGRPGNDQDPYLSETAGRKFKLNDRLGQNLALAEIDYANAAALQPEWHVPGGYTVSGETVPTATGVQAVSRLRPADLLLAMGVGPVQAPPYHLADSGQLRDQDYDIDAEWITLSEMLAIALGFDVPEANDPAYDATNDDEAAERIDDVYVGLVNDWADLDGDTVADWRYVLPGLRLSIDDFVPYYDVNPASPLDPFTYSTNALSLDANADIPAASGVPVALDVLGRVRQHEPWEPTNAPSDWRLTRPLPGVININTAPASVLRLLPGLTPSFESFDASGDTMPDTYAWWLAEHADSAGGVVPNLVGSEKTRRPDIAATIVAYRDRMVPEWRAASDTTPSGDVPELEYAPESLTSAPGLPTVGEWRDYALANFKTDRGRNWTTGIPGIRETPGFRGVGEVLAVTLSEEDPAGTTRATFNDSIHNTIQALGLDGEELEVYDLPGGKASLESDVYGTDEPDAIADELGERLATANGILGSISVSSDVYAVWFVVHAYRRSDVEDLKPGDPLVPGYARRYVMVVDRSTVTRESDAPRILLLREVPM